MNCGKNSPRKKFPEELLPSARIEETKSEIQKYFSQKFHVDINDPLTIKMIEGIMNIADFEYFQYVRKIFQDCRYSGYCNNKY